jgi:phosphoglycolate phosphatase-like HAD superfamily hydrolase
MIERFERIFRFSLAAESALALRLCERFLGPIFEVGRVCEDTPHVLASLRSEGHQLAVVSNAPWGSPPQLWREELQRLGLAELVDTIVLCGDVGRRKPAPQIFAYAATALDRTADQCIFVGDDLRWDISGSKAVGMRPILVDRDQRHNNYTGERVASPDRARSRAVRARSVGVDCMESRTLSIAPGNNRILPLGFSAADFLESAARNPNENPLRWRVRYFWLGHVERSALDLSGGCTARDRDLESLPIRSG